jgi:hypothetical protein
MLAHYTMAVPTLTSLGITWNDKRYAHKDEDDAKLDFIIWFGKGMTSNHCIRVTITLLCTYVVERTNPKCPTKGGQFVLPCHKLYVQPRLGTLF